MTVESGSVVFGDKVALQMFEKFFNINGKIFFYKFSYHKRKLTHEYKF